MSKKSIIAILIGVTWALITMNIWDIADWQFWVGLICVSTINVLID